MRHRHETPMELPVCCGFNIPQRVSARDVVFLKQESEEEKYQKLERLWDSLWTGKGDILGDRSSKRSLYWTQLIKVKDNADEWFYSNPSQNDLKVNKRLLVKRLSECFSRRKTKTKSAEFVISASQFEDVLMPAFPEGYRDPVAIY